MPFKGAEIGITAVLASLVLAFVVAGHFIGGGGPVLHQIHYLDAGFFHLDIGEYVDGLTAAMFVVVTVVSALVQIYSTSYMHGDRRYTWFFAALSLFTASMLTLVVADNMIMLLVGWEL